MSFWSQVAQITFGFIENYYTDPSKNQSNRLGIAKQKKLTDTGRWEKDIFPSTAVV